MSTEDAAWHAEIDARQDDKARAIEQGGFTPSFGPFSPMRIAPIETTNWHTGQKETIYQPLASPGQIKDARREMESDLAQRAREERERWRRETIPGKIEAVHCGLGNEFRDLLRVFYLSYDKSKDLFGSTREELKNIREDKDDLPRHRQRLVELLAMLNLPAPLSDEEGAHLLEKAKRGEVDKSAFWEYAVNQVPRPPIEEYINGEGWAAGHSVAMPGDQTKESWCVKSVNEDRTVTIIEMETGATKEIALLELHKINPSRPLTADETKELGVLLRDEASYRDVNKMRRALNLVKQRYENVLSEGDPQNIRATVENALRSLDATVQKLKQQEILPQPDVPAPTAPDESVVTKGGGEAGESAPRSLGEIKAATYRGPKTERVFLKKREWQESF